MALDILKQFGLMTVNDTTEIDEIADYLAFGKLIFASNRRIKFLDTSCLLRELKVSRMESNLLPPSEALKGFYDIEEIMIFCKKNNFQHLLNISIRVSFEYILNEVKEYRCSKSIKLLLEDIKSFLEVFEAEKTCFEDDFSVHVVCFVESLFNLMDTNYSLDLNAERVRK